MKNTIEMIVLSPFVALGFLWHGIVAGFQAGRVLYVVVMR